MTADIFALNDLFVQAVTLSVMIGVGIGAILALIRSAA